LCLRSAQSHCASIVADSSESTGLKWVAPAGAATEYTLLNTGGTSMSGSTTVTVNITAYNHLFIAVDGAASGPNSFKHLRFNTNTNSDYVSYVTNITGYNTPSYGRIVGAGAEFNLGRGNNEGTLFSAGIQVSGAKATTAKIVNFCSNHDQQSANNDTRWGTGRYLEAATITSVSIISTNDAFSSGTLFIYGAN
jgi:hypothetical protein